MKKKLGYLLVAVVLLLSTIFPIVAVFAEISSDTYYDVLILVDTSVSMRYDCEDPSHSYFSSSALTSSGLAAENIYKHYVVAKDASGNIKVSASAICNPSESCSDRLHDATAAAKKIAQDILSIGDNNRVAITNFNSAVVNKNFVYNDNIAAVNTAVDGLTSLYAGLTSYTNALNQAAARMTTAGVTRSGAKQVVIIISDGIPAASSGNSIDIVVKDYVNYTGTTAAQTLIDNGTIDKLLTLSVGTAEGKYLSGTGATANMPDTTDARTDFLKRLDADCDSAETYKNVRDYFKIPYVPTITTNLNTAEEVAFGKTVTFSVAASVSVGSIKGYQWYHNGTAISGATSASYTVTGSDAAAGEYYVVVTSSTDGTATSKTCAVTVRKADQPVFTTDLAAEKAVKLLTSFTLTVEAKADYSDKLEYQWYKDGAEISGATSASYTVDSAEEEDAGSYSVKVKNTYGTSSAEATSEVCAVSVTENADIPVITDQPKGFSVGAEDTSFTLSVTATAAEGGVISYQWYKDGAAIDGATAAEYSVTTPDPETDAGKYTVKVTNAVGGKTYTTTSAAAEVSFDDYYDVLILVDTSISMRNDCEDPDHSYVSASVRDSNGLAADSIYKHYIVSKDEDGNVKIDASAIVNPTESCGDRLHDATAAAKSIAKDVLSLGNYNKVAVANFNTVIVKKDNVVYNSEISAVNTAVNGFTALYGGNTAYGDVLNEAADSIVKVKGRKGAEQVVILISDGIPANSSGNSKDMILQTSDQYTGVTAAQTLLGNGTFDKLLTVVVGTDQGTYLSSTGQPAALHANLKASRDKLAALDADCGTAKTYNNVRKYFGMTQLPEITGDPEKTLSTVEGKQVTLAVEAVAADNGTLTYQWYKDGAKIDGAASASYSFTAAAELDGAKYHVVVTGVGGGTATSAICELTVICADEPDITTDLAAAKVMPLQASAELEVAVKTPVYGTLSYQWYKNGVKIDGATKASYGIADVKESDAGSYQVKITNTYETSVRTAESTVCTVTVAENPNIPVITAQPKDVTVGAKDKSFTLSAAAAAAEGGTLSYQWYKDGVKIDGATSAAYTETDPDPEKDAGRYTVRVTNTVAGEGSFTSTSKEAKVSFDEYYDVLVLVDTSVSMRYDCEDPAHSYFSASALTSSGLDAENIYKHYVVSTDADGNIKVDASAICNPAESCGDRLHDATAAARKIAEDVLSIGNYNKVAVANFNSAVVNKNFVYNDNMTSVNTAVNGLAAIYGGITSYTNALNQAAARMTTAGVTRSGAKQVVILISDGVPAASSGNSIDIVVKDHENYTGVAAAKTLLENGTIDKLMTLSVGSEEGTYLSGTGAEAPVPAALKARTDFLKRLDADCDSAETYNNVRAYFGLPAAPEKPVITKDIAGQQYVTTGSEVTLTVGAETADKGTLSYQWYKNGTAISGATGAGYTFTAALADDGAKYSVKVTNTTNGESASVNSGEFELLVRESAPLDVVILMDTSKSMAFDCGNDAHSYLSNSVMEANGITGKLYNHYVVNKAADGTISIDASAIQNPAEDCGDRLHQAQAAAKDIIDAIYAQSADNRVAVCGFNSVVVPLGSADAKLSFRSNAAAAKADLTKLRVPYAGATNYTDTLNGTESVRGIRQMLAEKGVLRNGSQPVVIIISDGAASSNDTGTNMAGSGEYNGIAAAEALKAAGIDVLTVGVGETEEAMKVYLADGSLSAKLTNLLANHETLKVLGAFDTADTWNNVRSYLGMPEYPKQPEITKDLPEEILAMAGEQVTVEIAAAAENGELTYQWYLNGAPVSGVSGAAYTFTATEEMKNAKLRAEAVNTLNGNKASVFSDELTLTVTKEQAYDIVLLVDTSKSMSYDCENDAHSYQTQKQYDLLKPDYAFNTYRHGLLKKLNGYTVTDADPAKGYYIDAGCSNRLQDAQAAAEEIADMIYQNSPDSRVAVTGFNTVLLDQAFSFSCASADDVDAALKALVNHELAYKGATNYTDVLNQVSDRLAKEGVGRIGTKKIVIMISDGCPSQNDIGGDKSADAAYNGIAASEALVKAGVDVYTVGVGSGDMMFYQPNGTQTAMTALSSNDEMLEKLGKFSGAEYLNNIRELFGLPEKSRVDANKYDGLPEGEVNVLFLVDTSKSMQYDCHNPYHSYQTRSMYDKLDPSYPFNQYRHGKLTVEAGNYVVKTDPENLWYIKDECYNRLHEAEEIAEEIAAQILADNPKANFAVTGFNTQLTDSRIRFDLDSTAEVNEELRGLLYGEKAYAGTTNYTEVLKQVRAELQETHPDVPTVVIMISDGTASDNEVGKNLNRSEKYNGLREAQELKQDGFKLYTLAVGNLSKSMYFYTPSGINTVDMKALRASDAVLKEMGNYSIGYDWNKLIYAEGEEPGDGGYSKRGSGTYIDAFAAEGGSITDEGRTAMGRGKSKTYQVTADEGWSVYKVVAMPAYVDPGTQQEILDVDADGKFTVTADTSYVIRAYFTKNGLVKGQMDDYNLQNVYDTVTLPEGPLDVIFMMDTSKSMWHDCQNAQHSYMTRKQYDIQSLNRWYPFSNYAHGQVTSYKNSTVVDADAFFGYYVDEYCQTRLQDSVLIAKQLVKKVLDSNEDNRVAIAGFRDVLTSDQYGFNKKLTAETAEEALDAMLNPYNADTYAGPTNYSAPLEAMKKGLLKKTRKDATTVIVMLTDGIPSTNDAGNNSASDRERNGMDQINALKEQGVKVITISVGQLTEAMQFYQPEGNRSTMTALCTSDMLLRMLGDEYYEGEKLLHPEEEILPVTKPAAPSAPEKEPAKDAVEIVDEPLETKDFPWWIVIVCAAVVIAAAVLIVIVCRKNKGNKKGNNF